MGCQPGDCIYGHFIFLGDLYGLSYSLYQLQGIQLWVEGFGFPFTNASREKGGMGGIGTERASIHNVAF